MNKSLEQTWMPLKNTTKKINFIFPSDFRVKPRIPYILRLFLKRKRMIRKILETEYIPLKENPIKKEFNLPEDFIFESHKKYILKLDILKKSEG